ncbi:MAG TPA: aminoglycoside phosphotransferase family protein [Gaiellaceae bacterium]
MTSERLRIPAGLDWWRCEPGGADWLERLPRLVAACRERWSLGRLTAFEPAHISLVLAVERLDGTPAVLKVNFPEPESEHEADALAHWRGEGAVRLLEHDPDRRALLLERCDPGTQLWAVDDEDEANAIAAAVLRRLWRPPAPGHPFRLLAAEAERWAEELPRDWEAAGRPFERLLLDEAVSACRELTRGQPEQVVLHQDFHGGNVLRAARERWLAIDPKPLAGERAFDAASLLRDRRWLLREPGAARRIRRRLDLLSAELGLDRERARRWGIVHALAWGVSGDGKVEADMVECARLLLGAS